MTSRPTSALPRLRDPAFRRELGALVSVAAPLVTNNLITVAIQTTDVVMAGRLSARDLAAVAVGGSIWMPLFIFGIGVMMAMAPLAAFHHGAGEPKAIGATARQALWLSLGVSALLIGLIHAALPLYEALGYAPEVARLAQGYLYAIAWGVPGIMMFEVLRFTSTGVGLGVPIMLVSAAALPVNMFGNYVLMYGKFGAPALGAVGCGWSTAITYWLMCLGLAAWMRGARLYRDIAVFERFEAPRWREIRAQLAIGLPIGVSVFMEASMFAAVALLMGTLGAHVVAAHQVALNYAALMFMVPLGVSQGLTARVGQAMGRGEPARARYCGTVGLVLCMAFACVSAAVILVAAEWIVSLYTRDSEVAALAAGLLLIAALFQLSDGLQVCAAGALRGIKDTRVPMLMTVGAYWGLGFPLAWLMGVRLDLGPLSVWLGLVLGLTVAAVALIWRFYRVMGRVVARERRGSGG